MFIKQHPCIVSTSGRWLSISLLTKGSLTSLLLILPVESHRLTPQGGWILIPLIVWRGREERRLADPRIALIWIETWKWLRAYLSSAGRINEIVDSQQNLKLSTTGKPIRPTNEVPVREKEHWLKTSDLTYTKEYHIIFSKYFAILK